MDSLLIKEAKKLVDYSHEVGIKPYIYLEQITYLIFLKLIDEGVFEKNRSGDEKLVMEEEVYYDQASRYEWKNWVDKPREELADFLRNEVFPFMSSLENEERIINEVFNNAKLQIESPEVLHGIVHIINSINFSEAEYNDRVNFFDYLVNYLLRDRDWQLAQYWTPRDVSKLIVELIKPNENSNILDPSCGSGTLLAEFLDFYRDKNQATFSVTGVDLSRSMIRLTLLNLLMRNVLNANIYRADFLRSNGGLRDDILQKKFDIIVADPPLKEIIPKEEVREGLADYSKRAEILYLNAINQSLTENGIAAVILPDSFLFSPMKDYLFTRREMINSNQILGIISLPKGAFSPHHSISLNLLIFRKGSSQSENKIWFYELDQNDRHRLSIRDQDFDSQYGEIIELWSEYRNTEYNNPPGPKASEQLDVVDQEPHFWWASQDQIRQNDYDLTFNLYRPLVSKEYETKAPMELMGEIKVLSEQINKELSKLEVKVSDLSND